MSIVTNISEAAQKVNEKLHKIRIKLYPNYLSSKVEGSYIPKTANEASLSIEEVCKSLKDRGGYPGDYETLVDAVKRYYNEVAYQLCDGFSVNNGYYSIHPSISCTFNHAHESVSSKKDRIGFKFRVNRLLRNLAQHFEFEIVGVMDGNAYIHEFVDNWEESVNTLFVPGDVFTISGNKIKVEGDDPDVGVYFVPVDAPSEAVKVKRFVENYPSKIIGEAPDTKHLVNVIEIRTQYSGSKTLKKPRVIRSSFTIESA
ncbi:MAG: DUF4469 domain-containing protein [Treponema sp.]|jgi:hypothetical protein|nr:DUF4469 domain-containing protein [Treponema sp.]